jgi:hypothetical protein
MSTFVQPGSFDVETVGNSLESSWLSRVFQFESIASLHRATCYGRNIGAYDFTVMKLCGPGIVLVFALVITLVLKLARSFLQRRNVSIDVSIFATCAQVILLIYSSVLTVAFKLVACIKIELAKSQTDVVFIDGNQKCYDERHSIFIAVIVLLCAFPPLFAAALHWRWLPQNVQDALCGPYSELRFYWSAVMLLFRLLMSIVFTTIRSLPSNAAMTQSFLCIAILVLLVYQKPYRHQSTHLFDIMCHFILAIQFVIVAIMTVSESLGIVLTESNLFYYSLKQGALAIFYLRYSPIFLRMKLCSLNAAIIISRCASLSLVPFIVGSVLWLYLQRAAISDKTSLAWSLLKGTTTACWFKYRGPNVRTFELGNSTPLISG